MRKWSVVPGTPKRIMRLKKGVIHDEGSWNDFVECKYRKHLKGVPGLGIVGRGMYTLDPVYLNVCAEVLSK